MNTEPLISVIIPVYNVESYVDKCLKSVINQSYKNLEIIIVNDGSTDSSALICRKYLTIDKRIIFINQKNKGLSSARNTGLNVAQGEFIGFVDSDDYIHSDMYLLLMNALRIEQADLAIGGYEKVFDTDEQQSSLNINFSSTLNYNCTRSKLFNHLFDERAIQTIIACNKLYKRYLFDNVRYPIGKIHEDEFVIHHILNKVSKAVYLDLPLYLYVQRKSSIMNTPFSLKNLDLANAYNNRFKMFQSIDNNHLMSKALYSYLSLCMSHYYSVKKLSPDKQDVLKEIRRNITENVSIYNSLLPPKFRRNIYFFIISPVLYQTKHFVASNIYTVVNKLTLKKKSVSSTL
ncbi:glycosyltransferase family 2 protein [Alkalicoccus luteus]|uniref:Glycosyltransferase family 2 protein n=1 Tax=Alkalicoccus luteus TaxID=1237094 RepID=A0A969PT94_9BACI|nr:glycosyltransferase family 2 protein [Alkalicoccus luteus]NJP38923.1 glycosyltransferase family 2 protein [Alkalicoccus luteus]